MAQDDRESRRLPQILLLAAVTVLAAASGMAALARQVAELGPRVGDIVTFVPGQAASFDGRSRLIAGRPGEIGCVLDVVVIQETGGSLVVEQRDAGDGRLYRAHWAGPRTSKTAANCGADADLILSAFDMGMLAAAAGGDHRAASLSR
jgi:hypothetical protein